MDHSFHGGKFYMLIKERLRLVKKIDLSLRQLLIVIIVGLFFTFYTIKIGNVVLAEERGQSSTPLIDALDYAEDKIPSKAAIDAAIADIGTELRILVLRPGIWSIDSNVTVPSNITLRFERGAVAKIANGKTLTINGGLEAGLHQIFDWKGNLDVWIENDKSNNIKMVNFVSKVKEVFPQWWGAIGDYYYDPDLKSESGADDTDAIKAACDCAGSGLNAINVVFPNGSYKISNHIVVPLGVDLIGKGGKIFRTHTNPGRSFSLFGNNRIDGLHFDGGRILVKPIIGPEKKCEKYKDSMHYTCYYEFVLHESGRGKVTFTNCKFDNAAGNFITWGGQKDSKFTDIRIAGNYFGEYLDHAIYLGAETPAQNIIISDNKFYARKTETVRPAIKLVNGIHSAVVSNNTVNLTYGAFIKCELRNEKGGTIENIVISNNVIYCDRFLYIYSNPDKPTPYRIGSISVINNTVTTTKDSSFCLLIGDYTQGAKIEKLLILGNFFNRGTFYFRGLVGLNKSITGIDQIIIDGNQISSEQYILMYGNIRHMVITGNNYNTTNSSPRKGLVTNLLTQEHKKDRKEFAPNIECTAYIADNIITGNWLSLVYVEDEKYDIDNLTYIVEGNKFLSHNSKKYRYCTGGCNNENQKNERVQCKNNFILP